MLFIGSFFFIFLDDSTCNANLFPFSWRDKAPVMKTEKKSNEIKFDIQLLVSWREWVQIERNNYNKLFGKKILS